MDDPGVTTDVAPDIERGRKIASFMGRITLYDPDPATAGSDGESDLDDPAVKEVEEEIVRVLAELGYVATIDLTKTTNSR